MMNYYIFPCFPGFCGLGLVTCGRRSGRSPWRTRPWWPNVAWPQGWAMFGYRFGSESGDLFGKTWRKRTSSIEFIHLSQAPEDLTRTDAWFLSLKPLDLAASFTGHEMSYVIPETFFFQFGKLQSCDVLINVIIYIYRVMSMVTCVYIYIQCVYIDININIDI